jgi:hypothetical protein
VIHGDPIDPALPHGLADIASIHRQRLSRISAGRIYATTSPFFHIAHKLGNLGNNLALPGTSQPIRSASPTIEVTYVRIA